MHIHWAFDDSREALRTISAATRYLADRLQVANRATALLVEQHAEGPPEDSRERALWLRRNRSTGPQIQQRAPRRIDARGSR